MRKLIPFLLLVILFSCEKEISEKQADYFLKFYGSYRNDVAADVAELPDGGYVIVGTSETETRGTDISMILTDKYGRQLGETKYFGEERDEKSNGLYLFDGGLLISGALENEDGTLDALVLKTDFSGNKIGALNSFGGDNDDEVFSSIKKDDGGFLFVGYTNSDENSNLLYTIITDDNFENPNYSAGENGDQIVLSSVLKYRENQYFTVGTRIVNPTTNASQISILQINEAGNPVLRGDYGDPLQVNEFSSLVQQNDSTLFLLSTLSELGSDSKLNLRKIVYKLDPVNTANFLYIEERASYIYSETGSLEANSLAIKEDGSLALLGTKTVSLSQNIVLLLVDENGNQIGETKEFGGSGDQSGTSIICSNGQILILGNSSVGGNSMFTLIKTDDQGNLWN